MRTDGHRHRPQFPLLVLCVLGISCTDLGDPAPPASVDDRLFRQITEDDPFVGWADFPQADSVTTGTLNGSQAHRPIVHVRINAIAAGALVADTLPQGSAFPAGSMIVKTIFLDGRPTLFAVIRKEPTHALAAQGWLWAEFEPGGRPFVSVTSRGAGCVGCHARERGSMNDFVRTFERQHR